MFAILSIGVLFLPSVKATDGDLIDHDYDNTLFLETGFDFDYDLVKHNPSSYYDDRWDVAPSVLGVSNFASLGYQYFDNDTGLVWFLGLATIDIEAWVYTTYASAEHIFEYGNPSTQSTPWLLLWHQNKFPYYDGSTLTTYDINYKAIQSRTGYVDAYGLLKENPFGMRTLGFDADFQVTATYSPFTNYIAVTDDGTEVPMQVPQVKLVDGRILTERSTDRIETEYATSFTDVSANSDTEGGDEDQIDDFVTDVGMDSIKDIYATSWGLQENTITEPSLVPILGDPIVVNAVAGQDMEINKTEQTAQVHMIERPRLDVWQMSWKYYEGALSMDVAGWDAGVKAPFPEMVEAGYTNGFTLRTNKYAVGYEVENPACYVYMQLDFYVWGSAYLEPNLRDSILQEPEFRKGDTYWDIAIFGDESASILFTKSYLSQVWGNLATKWKVLITVIIIALLVGGGFFLLKKLNVIGGLGGGNRGGGRNAPLIAWKSNIKVDDRDTSGLNINTRDRKRGRG